MRYSNRGGLLALDLKAWWHKVLMISILLGHNLVIWRKCVEVLFLSKLISSKIKSLTLSDSQLKYHIISNFNLTNFCFNQSELFWKPYSFPEIIKCSFKQNDIWLSCKKSKHPRTVLLPGQWWRSSSSGWRPSASPGGSWSPSGPPAPTCPYDAPCGVHHSPKWEEEVKI